MARPKRTEAELLHTRAEILDHALEILKKSGYEALTIRAVADRMNVAPMTLYSYFDNQPAILRALRERELTIWRNDLEQFCENITSDNVWEKLDGFVRKFIDFARQQPQLYRMAWVMSDIGVETIEENQDRVVANVRILGKLIYLGSELGVFEARDPFISAGAILAIINTPYILFFNGKVLDEKMRDILIDEILNMVHVYLKKNNPVSLPSVPEIDPHNCNAKL